ncbi:MAG: hypothetical protein IPN20_23555 [Haliscomenobacter sp.]|nr:hypothetical protein [Haliscomenobacter sp.]
MSSLTFNAKTKLHETLSSGKEAILGYFSCSACRSSFALKTVFCVFAYSLMKIFTNFIVGRCLELDSGLVFKLSDLNQNGNHFEKGVEYLSIYYRPLGISGALKVKDQMTFNLRGQSYQALVSPPNILVKPCLSPLLRRMLPW